MTQHALGIHSPYTYIWHDKAGQVIPENSKEIIANVNIDGMHIDIPDNCVITDTIVIINSAATGNTSKNTITLGKNSKAQVLVYLMGDDKNSTNTVNTEVYCAANSNLQYCILQCATEDPTIIQKSATTIFQAAASTVHSNIFSFGGGLNRIELTLALQGKGAHCNTSSLAYTHGSETQEVVLKIEHMVPNCTSQSTTRNVLKDKSSTDLTGRIIVHPGANKTAAELQIKNLLCSPKAQATNKPELEIFNDDVRCTHGSSTGQLDEDALFYMRSRGIGIEEATSLLIAGFIQPVIQSCTINNVADFVNNIIKDR